GETIETTSDDEPEDEPKRNIDTIELSGDEDEEKDFLPSSARKEKGKATASTRRTSRPGFGLRPVRARRTLGDDEEPDGQNDASPRKKRPSAHKRLDSSSQEISSDDRDGDPMELDWDSAQLVREPPSS